MEAINIRLAKNHDGTMEFVEIENDEGKSIGIGTPRHEGMYLILRITKEEIAEK